MADDWQVGDLALCVDDRTNPAFGAFPLAKGQVYKVSHVSPPCGWVLDPAGNGPGLELYGVESRGFWGFACERFRKIRPDQHERCEDEFITLLDNMKQPQPVETEARLNRLG